MSSGKKLHGDEDMRMMKMKPKWMNLLTLFRTLCMLETPRYLTQKTDMSIKEQHLCMRICWTSRLLSGSMRNDMVLPRDLVLSYLHPRGFRRPGNKSFMSKNWKQKLDISFVKATMEKWIATIRLYCSNLDLNLVTCTWPRKCQI
jgi:hypothetical protein